jgi:hypothetical protein
VIGGLRHAAVRHGRAHHPADRVITIDRPFWRPARGCRAD